MENDVIVAGLVNGRHKMPVKQYLFQKVPDKDVLKFSKLEYNVQHFMLRQGVVRRTADGVRSNCKELIVYVTGLTAATAAVIKCCEQYKVPLTLMHFDSKTGGYLPQKIF